MDRTTRETRRQSYDAVLPKREKRCRLILETLGAREMTASEITEELVAAGKIPYFNRNYVAPRLTEMKQMGILKTVGRRKATRSDATEAVWARVHTAAADRPAADPADNPATGPEQMTLLGPRSRIYARNGRPAARRRPCRQPMPRGMRRGSTATPAPRSRIYPSGRM